MTTEQLRILVRAILLASNNMDGSDLERHVKQCFTGKFEEDEE